MASSFSAAYAARSTSSTAPATTSPSTASAPRKGGVALIQTFKGDASSPSSWRARPWQVQTTSPEVVCDFSSLAALEAAFDALTIEAHKQGARNRAAKAARLKAAKATVLAKIKAYRAMVARVGSNVARATMEAFQGLKEALANRRTAAMARQEGRSASPFWTEVSALRARMADLLRQFPDLAAL